MKAVTPGFHPIRRDQLRPERIHDTYMLRGKLKEPARCPRCGAVYHAGRWQWGDAPAGAHETTCSACHRIADHFPAGYVEIGGPFYTGHQDEILTLIRHHETREKAEHPMARIIAVEQAANRGSPHAQVTTTDIHLARNLGEALHSAYQGELDFHYNPGEDLLRVFWRR